MTGNLEDYPAVFDSALVIQYLAGTGSSVYVGSCPSGVSCTSIAAGNSVSITNTANNALITNIYNTLRNHLSTENTLLTNLSNAIIGNNLYTQSPNLYW